MATIDHLMWVVPALAAGIGDLEARTGGRATLGGSHPSMGTANAILGLGPGVYLEVLGPDPALAEPTGFGAAIAAELSPRLASWAVRTDDIDAVCAALTAAGWPTTANAMTRTRRWSGGSRCCPAARSPITGHSSSTGVHRLIPRTTRRAPVE